jgi:hypothetical protein
MDSSKLIGAGGLAVAALSLAVALYTAWRTRRDREKDQEVQELRFRQINEPVLIVKPQFSLAPTHNRLLLDVTNLHGSIAVRDVTVRCRSQIDFDAKVERQDVFVTISALKPQETTTVEVGGFFCDFDSFVANLGQPQFNHQLSQTNVAIAIQTLQDQGYLKNGQAPVGKMSVRWQYKPAQPDADPVTQEVAYKLFIWRYGHGVFLSFEWPSVSGH